MKIGFCMFLWTTNVTGKHTKLLKDIKATGYDGVEIPIFEGTPDDYKRLGEMLDRIGLERTAVTAMGDPGMNLISPDAATRRKGIAYMKWAIDCAAALGAVRLSGPLHSTLGAFTGVGPTPAEKKRSVASQRAIGDHAGKSGVTIGLEALNRFECYLLNTMADLSAHVDEIDHPQHQGDVRHLPRQHRGGRPDRRLHEARQEHLSTSTSRKTTAACPGAATSPGRRLSPPSRESGYDGWLTIEAFGRGLKDLAAATKVWRDFAESPEAVYREGFAHIRKHWKKAGR